MSKGYFNQKQVNALPRINSYKEITIKNFKNKNAFFSPKTYKNKKDNINNNNFNNNLLFNRIDKKPGTSIDKKKSIFILPKIAPNKLSNTANIKTSNSNNINNNFYFNQFAYQYNNNVEGNNQINEFYSNYKNISINILENDNELKKMFEEIYDKSDYQSEKQWIEENLFNREVFRIMLESYAKKNGDVNSFIRNEISKILNNKKLDNMLLKSFKQIQFQYDEYINNVHNL